MTSLGLPCKRFMTQWLIISEKDLIYILDDIPGHANDVPDAKYLYYPTALRIKELHKTPSSAVFTPICSEASHFTAISERTPRQ